MLNLVGIAVALVAQAAAPPACAPGMVVHYDELHWYSVQSPPGWCFCPDGVFRPRKPLPVPDQPEIRVSQFYVAELGQFESSVQRDLKRVASGGTVTQRPSLQTRKGLSVLVWSVYQPTTGHCSLVAYLLQEQVCVVRIMAVGRSAAGLEAAAVAFDKLVASYAANI